ncbi:hypothetical protein [Demequina rhizosphaerae]|uniref:hypothetical protein n=2 Tax=Demequina rhizosphaerae TaxID=1638985 RepID=UPI000AA48E1F|nr:hypothetical protein [Demequina rhizosphaerae]
MGSTLARMRFTMLWLVSGIALLGAAVIFFYEPDVLAEGVAGEMEGEPVTMGMALMMAGIAALPLALAVASLFVPGRANAITNLVGGVALGTFGLFAAGSELGGGVFHAHLLLALVGAATAWTIAGLSIVALRRHSLEEAPPGSLKLEFTATAKA